MHFQLETSYLLDLKQSSCGVPVAEMRLLLTPNIFSRGVSSFAPAQIRQAIASCTELEPETIKGFANFERVIGVEQASVHKLLSLRCGSKSRLSRVRSQAILDSLGQWENVCRGKDLFLKGLGSFNVIEVYEAILQQRLPAHRIVLKVQVLDEYKATALTKAAKERWAQQNRGALEHRNRNTKDFAIRYLLQDPEFDIVQFVESQQVSSLLESARTPGNTAPTGPELANLIACPASLVLSPTELRAHAYFPNIISPKEWEVNLESGSSGMLDRRLFGFHPKGLFGFHLLEGRRPSKLWYLKSLLADLASEPCQHLIRFAHWWNNEDNSNALDEIMPPNLHSLPHGWPDGAVEMSPPQLLNQLRAAERIRMHGPDQRYISA